MHLVYMAYMQMIYFQIYMLQEELGYKSQL